MRKILVLLFIVLFFSLFTGNKIKTGLEHNVFDLAWSSNPLLPANGIIR